MREQRPVTDERDPVLNESKRAHDETQRTAGGFAPGASQLVVELGVLEVLQLERERLLENHHIDALTELGTQQRLTQRDAALSSRNRSDQHALEDHELDDAGGIGAAGT